MYMYMCTLSVRSLNYIKKDYICILTKPRRHTEIGQQKCFANGEQLELMEGNEIELQYYLECQLDYLAQTQ